VSAAPPRKRPKDRKATILAGAAELFAANGYAAVGVDDIGRRVGVTGPAIYRHFPGKEAVLAAVVLGIVDQFIEHAEEASQGEPGMDAFISSAVAISLDHPSELATYVRERHRLPPDQKRILSRRERKLFTLWHEGMLAARPELDEERLVVREQAAVGALNALSQWNAGPPRPRLDHLLTTACLAVVLAPAAPERADDHDKPPPPWRSPRTKRDDILEAALPLFRERGFHGVGIDEIGERAGISGPAVYRHYAGKADILVDAYDRAGARVQVGVEEATASATSAADALDRLARSYAEVAIDSVDLIVVTGREGMSLPEDERPRLARRRRGVRDAWTAVLRELRPDLAETEARALVAAWFVMTNVVVQAHVTHAPWLAEDIVAIVRAYARGAGR